MADNQKILHQTQIETQLGPMVAIADQQFLYLLEFIDRHGLEDSIKKLKKTINSTIIPGRTTIINLIEKELHQYFDGTLQTFMTPLHFSGSPFQQSVWSQLQKIPHGQTQSYAQLAIAVGNPAACRAVAQANGANKFLVIIPCHRIINSSGKLGGYSSGIDRKIWLLNHERNQGNL
ncbi:methylated-DNA--[protein]-cysteine S-methyltransferase [Candidatus Babeliales bacterium]|nr:methylated-DNA--[protein]-cysteine S-methyltransferase [Candidatus Babeliales bacterium]MBP9844225.1 methylated-DNA--[protein]-cysteine S-methyltransferase [Candidatus Babeliales bacterium]